MFNKKILIAVGLSVIVLAAIGVYSYYQKLNIPFLNMWFSKEYKVTEIKEFSENSVFSFNYPIFKDWEVKYIEKTGDNIYTIWLNWPENVKFEYPPNIIIKKIKEEKFYRDEFESVSNFVKGNPNGASYEFVYFPKNHIEGYDPQGEWDAIHFFSQKSDDGVLITTNTGNEEYGFSTKVFADEVIKSFKFTAEVSSSPKSALSPNFNFFLSLTLLIIAVLLLSVSGYISFNWEIAHNLKNLIIVLSFLVSGLLLSLPFLISYLPASLPWLALIGGCSVVIEILRFFCLMKPF